MDGRAHSSSLLLVRWPLLMQDIANVAHLLGIGEGEETIIAPPEDSTSDSDSDSDSESGKDAEEDDALGGVAEQTGADAVSSPNVATAPDYMKDEDGVSSAPATAASATAPASKVDGDAKGDESSSSSGWESSEDDEPAASSSKRPKKGTGGGGGSSDDEAGGAFVPPRTKNEIAVEVVEASTAEP